MLSSLSQLALSILWEVVNRDGVEDCFLSQEAHKTLYAFAHSADNASSSRILACDILKVCVRADVVWGVPSGVSLERRVCVQ